MPAGPNDAPRPLTEDMLERRVDFERGMSVFPAVTLTLIFACASVHAAVLAMKPALAEEIVYLPYAMQGAKVIGGEWRRLFTSIYLHGSVGHLFGNMFALFILGMGCEHAFGSARTLGVYLAAGLAGNLVGLMRDGQSVGASGAIFGLLGLLAASLWTHRARLVVRDQRVPTVLLCWAVYALLRGALSPQIDNLAHAGGFAVGLVAGRVLTPLLIK